MRQTNNSRLESRFGEKVGEYAHLGVKLVNEGREDVGKATVNLAYAFAENGYQTNSPEARVDLEAEEVLDLTLEMYIGTQDHSDQSAQPLVSRFQGPAADYGIDAKAESAEPTMAEEFKAPHLGLITEEVAEQMLDGLFNYKPQPGPITQVLPQPEITTGYGLAA